MGTRRILVAHPVPGLYGADRMMLAAMRVLAAEGHDVTVVVPETGPLLPLIERAGIGTRLLAFPVLRKGVLTPRALLWLALGAPWHVARLWLVIKRAKPDLVYVNTVTLPHWLVAARLAGVPVVCHVREAEHDMRPTLARLLLAPVRIATVVVANSAATARWLANSQPILADRVRVLYNGFSFEPAACADPPAERGRLVVVGRLSPRKGQDVALRAVARLVEAGRDVELHFVGDVFRGYEWYEAALVSAARELGLESRVFFDGFLADPTASYRSAGILVVPSRTEPFGNVAVEGMALGRPVVATGVGGLTEIIDDGETGLLCPPADVGALADAIARLLDDPELADRLAMTGAARVRERFGSARFATELQGVIGAALSSPDVAEVAE
ncbi:MAG: glycosyltransferase [Actinomycetota bacterium]